MLPQVSREIEPYLGIDEVAVRLAKLAHYYARERVLKLFHEQKLQRIVGSERLAASLFMLHALEHMFRVACIAKVVREPTMTTSSSTGNAPLALVLGVLTRSAPSREMGSSAVCANACVDLLLCAKVSQGMYVRSTRSPQKISL